MGTPSKLQPGKRCAGLPVEERRAERVTRPCPGPGLCGWEHSVPSLLSGPEQGEPCGPPHPGVRPACRGCAVAAPAVPPWSRRDRPCSGQVRPRVSLPIRDNVVNKFVEFLVKKRIA